MARRVAPVRAAQAQAAPRRPRPPQPRAGAPRTVLTVDDNPATRRFLRETLVLEGYRVVEAQDASSALARCPRRAPDLVVTDLFLRDMLGTELVRRMRGRPGFAHVPAIAFTGAPEELGSDPDATFDDVITKPADAGTLVRAVESALEPVHARAGAARRRPQVVLVDGDVARGIRSRLHLRRMGIDVTLATTAGEAIRAVHTLVPDLVIADLALPDGNGLDLAEELGGESVAFLVTSTEPWSDSSRRLARRAGVAGTVSLGPDLAELERAVAAVLDLGVPAAPTTRPAPLGTGDLERSRGELSVLAGLADLVDDPGDLETGLHQALARCMHAAGASRGAVFLLEDGGRFALRARLGDLHRLPGTGVEHRDELFRRVTRTGETIVLDHDDHSPIPDVRPRACAATVVVPVAAGDERLGVLVVEVPRHEDLRYWMRVLKLVGAGLGVAVAASRRATPGAGSAPGPGTDPLTGLADASALRGALACAAAGGNRGALLLVDVDRLRHVNDALGHEAGDELLRAAARRLEAIVEPGTTLARLHSDVFAILVPRVASPDALTSLARQVITALEEPLACKGSTLYATVSIGIAMFPDHARRPAVLLQHANTAVDLAKERGGNTFELYTTRSGTSLRRRLAVYQGLRAALERDELEVHFQPIVRIADGAVTGAEALLRWNRPPEGTVAAAEFIQIAEESGLIVAIGARVLAEACRQAQAWRQRGVGPSRVAVNVGAREFHHGHVVDAVTRALDESGLAAEALCLEITETVAMTDLSHAVEVLTRVRSLGVRVALDDFGTGYSSLRYLQDLPVDTLKIDRSFVTGAASHARGVPILTTMVDLAHRLGMDVVAEGIETEVQLALVRDLGCDEAQGFLLGRPAPVLGSAMAP